MKVSAKDFAKAKTILEIAAISKELKSKGANVSQVNTLASSRKREILLEKKHTATLNKVSVSVNVQQNPMSTLNLRFENTTTDNVIRLTSDNVVIL